jgi:hypothetical protein
VSGDYVWHADSRVTRGPFRPLRRPDSSRAAALTYKNVPFLRAPQLGARVAVSSKTSVNMIVFEK